MSIDEIRALKHAKPFCPFAIETKSGRTILIDDPIRIALSRSGKAVGGFGRDGHFDLLLADIVQLRQGMRRKRKKA